MDMPNGVYHTLYKEWFEETYKRNKKNKNGEPEVSDEEVVEEIEDALT